MKTNKNLMKYGVILADKIRAYGIRRLYKELKTQDPASISSYKNLIQIVSRTREGKGLFGNIDLLVGIRKIIRFSLDEVYFGENDNSISAGQNHQTIIMELNDIKEELTQIRSLYNPTKRSKIDINQLNMLVINYKFLMINFHSTPTETPEKTQAFFLRIFNSTIKAFNDHNYLDNNSNQRTTYITFIKKIMIILLNNKNNDVKYNYFLYTTLYMSMTIYLYEEVSKYWKNQKSWNSSKEIPKVSGNRLLSVVIEQFSMIENAKEVEKEKYLENYPHFYYLYLSYCILHNLNITVRPLSLEYAGERLEILLNEKTRNIPVTILNPSCYISTNKLYKTLIDFTEKSKITIKLDSKKEPLLKTGVYNSDLFSVSELENDIMIEHYKYTKTYIDPIDEIGFDCEESPLKESNLEEIEDGIFLDKKTGMIIDMVNGPPPASVKNRHNSGDPRPTQFELK